MSEKENVVINIVGADRLNVLFLNLTIIYLYYLDQDLPLPYKSVIG